MLKVCFKLLLSELNLQKSFLNTMKSVIARQVLSETPEEIHQFVRRHSELVLRAAERREEKERTQKDLAKRLGKNIITSPTPP